jgi:hypothetical protein
MMHGSRRFVTPARQPCHTPSHRTAKLRHVCCLGLRNFICICTLPRAGSGTRSQKRPVAMPGCSSVVSHGGRRMSCTASDGSGWSGGGVCRTRRPIAKVCSQQYRKDAYLVCMAIVRMRCSWYTAAESFGWVVICVTISSRQPASASQPGDWRCELRTCNVSDVAQRSKSRDKGTPAGAHWQIAPDFCRRQIVL